MGVREHTDGAKHACGDRLGSKDELTNRYSGEAERLERHELFGRKAAFGAYGERNGTSAGFGRFVRKAKKLPSKRALGAGCQYETGAYWGLYGRFGERHGAEHLGRVRASALPGGFFGNLGEPSTTFVFAFSFEPNHRAGRFYEDHARGPELGGVPYDGVGFVALGEPLEEHEILGGDDRWTLHVFDDEPDFSCRQGHERHSSFGPSIRIERKERGARLEPQDPSEVVQELVARRNMAGPQPLQRCPRKAAHDGARNTMATHSPFLGASITVNGA